MLSRFGTCKLVVQSRVHITIVCTCMNNEIIICKSAIVFGVFETQVINIKPKEFWVWFEQEMSLQLAERQFHI